jgi:hypothetical protein
MPDPRTLVASQKSYWLAELTDFIKPLVGTCVSVSGIWASTRGGFVIVVPDSSNGYFVDEHTGHTSLLGKMPAHVHFRAIVSWNDVVFACGYKVDEAPVTSTTRVEAGLHECGGERRPVLLACNLGNREPEWHSLYPSQMSDRKEFDALIVHQDRLIAVDNIILPKYLVIFNLQSEEIGNPRFETLASHGTYEEIISVANNECYLIILSSTVGDRGSSRYISIVANGLNAQVPSRYLKMSGIDDFNIFKLTNFVNVYGFDIFRSFRSTVCFSSEQTNEACSCHQS